LGGLNIFLLKIRGVAKCKMQNMFSKLSLKMTLPQVEINCNKNYISKK
jgi:hypothetical protein